MSTDKPSTSYFLRHTQALLIYAAGMLKPNRTNRVVACLVCWTCHSRMGPNHFRLKDGGAVCGVCQRKNSLGNLRKMSIQEVTEPSEILVCFTQGGTAAHALNIDCKTVLGPWIKVHFSRNSREGAALPGTTDERLAAHSKQMRRCGREAVTFGSYQTERTCSGLIGLSSEASLVEAAALPILLQRSSS